MTTKEFLFSVLHELASSAAQGSAYTESWDAEFRAREIDNIWGDLADSLRKSRGIKVTVSELQELDKQTLLLLGFKRWSMIPPRIWLIPLWMYNYINPEEMVTSITGEVLHIQDADLDERVGCLAFGISLPGDV